MSARASVYPNRDHAGRSHRDAPVTLQSILDETFAMGKGLAEHDAAQAYLRRALYAPLSDLFARPSKSIRGRLVHLAWDLAGGRGAIPPELPLLVELVHAGSLVVDDIEDDAIDRRGAPALHRRYGLSIALNAGNWLYFLPATLIERLPLSTSTQLAIHRRFSSTLLCCHQGQALDLTVRASEPRRAEVAAIVETTMGAKTGALMELAANLGALAAGSTGAKLAAISEFGRALGIGLQMLDDLGSILSPARRSKGLEDVSKSRLTWAWAYLAKQLDDQAFSALQTRAREVEDGREDPGSLLQELAHAITNERTKDNDGARKQVRTWLRATFDALRTAIGESPSLAVLQEEIVRMERSYG